jgi:hypothetical protein
VQIAPDHERYAERVATVPRKLLGITHVPPGMTAVERRMLARLIARAVRSRKIEHDAQ